MVQQWGSLDVKTTDEREKRWVRQYVSVCPFDREASCADWCLRVTLGWVSLHY